MKIDQYEYALVFSQAAEVNTFLATYLDGSGASMDVTAMIESFFSNPPDVPSLNIDVYQAVFAYHDGAFLFGIDMEAGINLSNLPLIGQMLPANETLRLKSQIIFSSARLNRATLGAINALMTPSSTPLPVPAGGIAGESLLLSNKVQFGDAVANLDLPIQIGQNELIRLDTGNLQATSRQAEVGSDIHLGGRSRDRSARYTSTRSVVALSGTSSLSCWTPAFPSRVSQSRWTGFR